MISIKKTQLYGLIIIILLIFSCTPPGYLINRIIFYEDKREDIVKTAITYTGIKYKESGSSPDGFDCSGFTMFVYKKNGLAIPRMASTQFFSGRRITIRSAKPGDLIFFNINNTKISHVGIYIGDNNFIHAPSQGKFVSYADLNSEYWKDRYFGVITYFIDNK